MPRSLASEEEVASVVVTWLESLGFDVYQEVACGGGVADIVARIRADVWAVEVKTSLSLALLVQAMAHRRDATRVYIAAPVTRNMNDVGSLCAELGIGLLQVSSGDSYDPPRVRSVVESRRFNRRPVALTKRLRPEHKTHAKAGTAGGGRWTPWRDTCEQLARLVAASPGITLKAAIDSIRHHYRSSSGARSSLAKWIADGKVPGVRQARVDGKTVLQIAEAA
jgi:hypothetical protein